MSVRSTRPLVLSFLKSLHSPVHFSPGRSSIVLCLYDLLQFHVLRLGQTSDGSSCSWFLSSAWVFSAVSLTLSQVRSVAFTAEHLSLLALFFHHYCNECRQRAALTRPCSHIRNTICLVIGSLSTSLQPQQLCPRLILVQRESVRAMTTSSGSPCQSLALSGITAVDHTSHPTLWFQCFSYKYTISEPDMPAAVAAMTFFYIPEELFPDEWIEAGSDWPSLTRSTSPGPLHVLADSSRYMCLLDSVCVCVCMYVYVMVCGQCLW